MGMLTTYIDSPFLWSYPFFFPQDFFDVDHLEKSSLNLLQYRFCFTVWFLAARHMGSLHPLHWQAKS